jgi:hypothetical protein
MLAYENFREMLFVKQFANINFRDRCSRKASSESGEQIFARNNVRFQGNFNACPNPGWNPGRQLRRQASFHLSYPGC